MSLCSSAIRPLLDTLYLFVGDLLKCLGDVTAFPLNAFEDDQSIMRDHGRGFERNFEASAVTQEYSKGNEWFSLKHRSNVCYDHLEFLLLRNELLNHFNVT